MKRGPIWADDWNKKVPTSFPLYGTGVRQWTRQEATRRQSGKINEWIKLFNIFKKRKFSWEIQSMNWDGVEYSLPLLSSIFNNHHRDLLSHMADLTTESQFRFNERKIWNCLGKVKTFEGSPRCGEQCWNSGGAKCRRVGILRREHRWFSKWRKSFFQQKSFWPADPPAGGGGVKHNDLNLALFHTGIASNDATRTESSLKKNFRGVKQLASGWQGPAEISLPSRCLSGKTEASSNIIRYKAACL